MSTAQPKRMRRTGVMPPPPPPRAAARKVYPWLELLEDLKARFQVSRPVRLVGSALAEVPMVVGWLRPVILLPASSLTGLSPEQLEAVLAHELAHAIINTIKIF